MDNLGKHLSPAFTSFHENGRPGNSGWQSSPWAVKVGRGKNHGRQLFVPGVGFRQPMAMTGGKSGIEDRSGIWGGGAASSTFNGRREGTSQGEFLRPPIREGGLGCGAGSLSRLEGDSRVVFVMYFARILEVFWGGGGVWHVLFRKCPILRSNSHKIPIFGGLPYQSSCLYAAIRHWSMHWDQIL